jgi:hypothetical protein
VRDNEIDDQPTNVLNGALVGGLGGAVFGIVRQVQDEGEASG